MKICAIICEFNPFHNGHQYLINEARKFSGCDYLLCIMSGSFTQRGEIAMLDKYERARHAISGGADCVIELPTPFAISPAEIFAEGAIKILSAIPEVSHIAFGCENAKFDFLNAAKKLSSESEEFKKELGENLSAGLSYIKSYALAAEKVLGIDISKPNTILGLEYAKAILKLKANIEILPIARKGADYNDSALHENFSSASAIRGDISNPLVKSNVPSFVTFEGVSDLEEYKRLARLALFETNDFKDICGIGEGLENRLKSLEYLPYDKLLTEATTSRYSTSRIRRILCANLLKIKNSEIRSYLSEDLYIKVLAVKKASAEVLSKISKAEYPVVSDGNGKNLKGAALSCFEKDAYSYSLFNFINKKPYPRKGYDYMITV